jgi:hypothetical protein
MSTIKRIDLFFLERDFWRHRDVDHKAGLGLDRNLVIPRPQVNLRGGK